MHDFRWPALVTLGVLVLLFAPAAADLNHVTSGVLRYIVVPGT